MRPVDEEIIDLRAAGADAGTPTVVRSSNRITARGFWIVLRESFSLVWRAARRVAMSAVAVQLVSGVSLVGQFLVGRQILLAFAVERADRPSVGSLIPEFAALGVLLVVSGLVSVLARGKELLLGEMVTRYVTGRLIDVTSSVDYASFEDPTFHDRLARAQANGATYTWSMVAALLGLLAAAVGIAATGFVLTAVAPLLIAVVLVAYVPLGLATLRNGRSQYEFAYAMTPNDRERGYLGDALMGKREAKELRVFNLAPFLRARYEYLYSERMGALRELVRTITRRSLVANVGSALVTIGAAGVLAAMTASGRIDVVDAGVAALAMQQMTTRIRSVNGAIGTLHQCGLFFADYVAFVGGTPPANKVSVKVAKGRAHDVAVTELRFVYPGTSIPVLHDVSLSLTMGETVALVGENGSGKTTLAKLLCGLYEPTRGDIRWMTETGEVIPSSDARVSVAAVFQDFVEYALPARDNIAVGDHRRFDDGEAIERAARMADADTFLAALPDGYRTRLSRAYEGGVDLSVGQWQRVALARAFFADRPFLVLDEPTAALDARAEAELFASMRELYRGRAVLLISHRFSSVMTADRILVLKDGRLIEQGTHVELMAQRGHYAELFMLQAAAYLQERSTADDDLFSASHQD